MDSAILLALVLNARRRPAEYVGLLHQGCSPRGLLEQEHGLLADDLLASAQQQLDIWRSEQIEVLTVLDGEYPPNLRAVADCPVLIFRSGRLLERDARSVAVIGSRRATAGGAALARMIARQLVEQGYTVNAGLAAGIDSAAHQEALRAGGRTVAVIGTGLRHSYPPQNGSLQRQIAARGAVISQFLPDCPPRRENFPDRNAVMSGISRATVIVEAFETSGARIQARQSLAQGRPVFLMEPVLDQRWARELAERPGAYVVSSPGELPPLVDRLAAEPPIEKRPNGAESVADGAV